ncbi:MAG: flagellar hook-associated family protein [Rhizobiales bacterium]|jgi:flagellar hook-associated protein 3 FlgL|nr:flagellar hook-associated family protein [Hyphomicrobiales bacterium]
MKTTFISSQAVSNAMRYQVLNMQQELAKAQTEVTTGKLADPGVTLGSRTGQAVSLSRDVDRLNGLVDSNNLISTRLTATQDALGQINDLTQTFLSALTADKGSGVASTVTQQAAQTALSSVTSILNTSVNGEYLFAGINTDVQPINDVSAAGSPAKQALDQAFQDHFGFPPSDPAAANITASDMSDFIDGLVATQTTDPAWKDNWSNATDQPITSRISLNETADTSVSANSVGTKKFMLAATMVSNFMQGNLSEGARDALVSKASDLITDSLTDSASQQAQLGLTQNKVSSATDRIKSQVDLFQRNLNDLEGVDPYEASTKITSLLGQIETSYALTARMQQLSLVNFLK